MKRMSSKKPHCSLPRIRFLQPLLFTMANASGHQRNKPMALCRILPAVALKRRWKQLIHKKGNSNVPSRKMPSKCPPSENLPLKAKTHQAKVKTKAPKRTKSKISQPVLSLAHSELLSIRQKAFVYLLNALGAGIVACFVYPESCASKAFTAVSFYILLILCML